MFDRICSLKLAFSTVFILMAYCNTHAATPDIVAHRGASYNAPENTVPSVMLAWEKGADATEVDIHMTRDHQIVVIHDSTTKRTADSNYKVAEVDYDQIASLDVGKWKSGDYAGTHIPLLSEVLTKVPKRKRIFIEIKCPATVLPYLQHVIESSALSSNQVVFIAFDWETIRETKIRFPESKCFWLSGFKKHKDTGEWSPSANELMNQALKAGVDGVDVYHGGPVDEEFVKLAHGKGLEVHVYTVNDRDDARRLAKAGVDGITSDRPAYLRSGIKEAR